MVLAQICYDSREPNGGTGEDLQKSWQQKTLVWHSHTYTTDTQAFQNTTSKNASSVVWYLHCFIMMEIILEMLKRLYRNGTKMVKSCHLNLLWKCVKTLCLKEVSLFSLSLFLTNFCWNQKCYCFLIWVNRLAVRRAAAITKKFASSIAPHITTILVHGKQVMFRHRWRKHPRMR